MLLWLAIACAPAPEADPPGAITLQWVGDDVPMDFADAQQGLWWSLAQLGAVVPPDAGLPDDGSKSEVFLLELDQVELPERAREALEEPVRRLVRSEAAIRRGHVDLGRFLMATVYDPAVYYAATGACPTLEGHRAAHPTDVAYQVTRSQLVDHERWVETSLPTTADAVSMETTSTDPGAPVEVWTAMDNGYFRFAVYEDGVLQPSSDLGQPGACMWCHEGSINLGDPGNLATHKQSVSTSQWLQIAAEQQRLLDQRRQEAPSALSDDPIYPHTFGEWVVEDFLQPGPERLAREWGWTVRAMEDHARARGWDAPEPRPPEFIRAGYRRDQVDRDAPLFATPVHPSYRQPVVVPIPELEPCAPASR